MTDYELMDMELERLNKNLDVYKSEVKAYRKFLRQKSSEEGRQLAALTEKLQIQVKYQNSDTELYGKNSFAALLNRQLVNAWVFAIENYGWYIKFEFKGDLISGIGLYDEHMKKVFTCSM